MRHKILQIVAFLIGWIPFPSLRRLLYSNLFGYKISKSVKIGFRTVIVVDSFIADEGVVIARQSSFLGAFKVHLGARTYIGRFNRFQGIDARMLAKSQHMGYEAHFSTATDCLINDDHFFDVYGKISIGSNSWIAGQASQFWTHGASRQDRNIAIGNDCYIGSAARFAPGSGIGDGVIVGMGSVVTKRIAGNDMVVAGVPAAKIKDRTPDDGFRFAKDW